MELATLCGIKACAIVFGPDGEIDSWPENPADARAMIGAYKDMYSMTLKSTEAITETETRRDANSDGEKKIANLEREIADEERENWRKIMRLMEAMNHALSDRIEFLKAVDDQRRSKTGEKKADSVGKDINGFTKYRSDEARIVAIPLSFGEEKKKVQSHVMNNIRKDLAPDLRVVRLVPDLQVDHQVQAARMDHLEVQREADRVLAAQVDHLEVQREWEVDRVLAGHREAQVGQEDHQSNLAAANNSIRRRSCNDTQKKK
ncbi:hypothetical protein RHSIM_Rhsim04G0216100 [Rhododendron simsii]|uniref:MADS-box domain-containing protein n=1 Tax=Rhododendron simsii TaxID=118357 RepID=A0A834H200_RHOSS|nr:hypothetical protein RHSIM_Rhsim04G0216100 [Rhododendron simsii]